MSVRATAENKPVNNKDRAGIKKIFARFGSKCNETGMYIAKGEKMYYDYSAKKCYSMRSNKAAEIELVKNDPDEKAANDEKSVAEMVQANEEAYFDNFCQQNNI